MCFGIRVRVQGLKFRVQGFGFESRVSNIGLRKWGWEGLRNMVERGMGGVSGKEKWDRKQYHDEGGAALAIFRRKMDSGSKNTLHGSHFWTPRPNSLFSTILESSFQNWTPESSRAS